ERAPREQREVQARSAGPCVASSQGLSGMRGKHRRAIAAIAVLVVLVAGCGGDDGPADAEPPEHSGTEQSEPVAGGRLTMAVWAQAFGFDPILHNGSATAGGIELAAVYDRLIVWNPETLRYDPGTAESVEPNDDLTEWTIRLRP